jgi:exopolysaccharide/PEP-CTERM locus tyrosine autokinase
MSKIQDALSRLQNDAKNSEAPKKQLRNSLKIRDKVPSKHANSDDIATEIQHVDRDRLIAQGLLPGPEYQQDTADEFRRIKRPLIKNAFSGHSDPEEHVNVLMMTSAMPRAGKSFCSVNLALSIAMERELNVLLVDADVAKPHITRAFGLEDQPGLIDLLAEDTTDLRNVLVRTDLYDIQVLPAGRAHPQATELLASGRMSDVVEELARRYPDRLIIIDSPPLLVTSEAQAIASQVGQIALVVEFGKTNRHSVTEVMDMLDSSKAVNVILNKSTGMPGGGVYGAGYGYYYDAEAD